MTALRALVRRELGAVLASGTGWTVLGGFLVLAGLTWTGTLFGYVEGLAARAYNPYAGGASTLTEGVLAPWLGSLAVVLLVVGPALSMRLLADEARRGTLEALLSAPVHPAVIVLGKFLGALVFLWTLVLSTLWMPLALTRFAPVDRGAIAAGYLGLLLLSAAVLAVGLLTSALTSRPTVAMLLGFAAVMLLWLVGWLDPDPTSIPSQLSLSVHLRDLLRGLVRASDVSYFVLLVGWSLASTTLVVARWRRP